MHVFERSLQNGKDGEDALDRYFKRWFYVHPVSREEERELGIDRVFIRKDNGKALTVEYKSDALAVKTGNAYVETTSVDRTNAPGWAKKSKADVLCYYLVSGGLVYAVRPDDIRKALPAWEQRFRTMPSKNDGYDTLGLLVPIGEFKRIAFKVLTIGSAS